MESEMKSLNVVIHFIKQLSNVNGARQTPFKIDYNQNNMLVFNLSNNRMLMGLIFALFKR